MAAATMASLLLLLQVAYGALAAVKCLLEVRIVPATDSKLGSSPLQRNAISAASGSSNVYTRMPCVSVCT